ncbi:MAG: 50S ribosomal protein L24 [Candidatus Altiarchaeales archaeon]|nr:50S ribosomal protein L24 [Candidatus Altiarchaeales archaeon]MBD3416346.1 50S ribosomal protein L24 [Candidatus Altiarchaeales archaeon]
MKMKRPSSKQARKQRKWVGEAPLHMRHRLVSAALSKDLKDKYKKNSMPLRKGDTVKVMRGSVKGHVGEVMKVDLKTYKVYVQGVTAKKSDGTDVERALEPSNLMITELHEEDKERRDALSRNMEAE